MGRCSAGHPLAGHGAELSRTHGLYVGQLGEALAAERAEFLERSLADDGGVAAIPTRRQSLHAYRARLHCHISALSDAIEEHGLFDKRNRLRAIWLQRLEGLIDRARAIDATLGLDRRARQLGVQEKLAAAIAAKASGQGGEA